VLLCYSAFRRPSTQPSLPAPKPTTGAATAKEGKRKRPLADDCSGALMSNGFFDKDSLDSLNNAFVMATLASDAYPTNVLSSGSNTKYNSQKYEAAVRQRWAALGARTVEFVDDFEEGMEAHALVAATASDVFIAFRGTSTPEGWAANARMSPWKVALGGEKTLQVHGGFLTSFVSVYPRIALAVAKVSGGRCRLSAGAGDAPDFGAFCQDCRQHNPPAAAASW